MAGSKTNAATAAQEGLDELMSIEKDEAPEATPTTAGSEVSPVTDDDEEMESVGGIDPIDFFFVHNKKPDSKPNQIQIEKDQEFLGNYEGSFVSGIHNSRTHKVKILTGPYAGKRIGLPSCQALDENFQFAPKNTRTQVTCLGTSIAKSGFRKGNYVFKYDVKFPKSVKEKIEAKQLPANYEMKPRPQKKS